MFRCITSFRCHPSLLQVLLTRMFGLPRLAADVIGSIAFHRGASSFNPRAMLRHYAALALGRRTRTSTLGVRSDAQLDAVLESPALHAALSAHASSARARRAPGGDLDRSRWQAYLAMDPDLDLVPAVLKLLAAAPEAALASAQSAAGADVFAYEVRRPSFLWPFVVYVPFSESYLLSLCLSPSSNSSNSTPLTARLLGTRTASTSRLSSRRRSRRTAPRSAPS